MKLVVIFTTILVLVESKPNGLYHEEYNYKSSSSSYRNNELQHQKDDEGYYSKHGDLEGRVQPKVNAREQHSEYVNPRIKNLGYTHGSSNGGSSSYGQLQTGQHYENVFQNGMYNQYHPSFPNGGGSNLHTDYGIQSNLRQLSNQVQQQLAQQLNEAIMNQYRRTTSYTNTLTQQQIDNDRRILEDELKRNVSLQIQDAIRLRYGAQGVRGGLSYTLNNGHLEPTANYNNQELLDLTQQLENDLIRQLNEGVRTYYHTSSSSSSHRVTSVKQQQQTNDYNHYPYPGHLQQTPPIRQPLPLQPQPLPIHLEPTRIDYGPVIPNPDSLTTIATRVQHDLNEHLNKILDDTKQRYFSSSSYYQTNNLEQILQQLKDDLHHNVTQQFELQLHQQPQRYKIEDLENYKRQIENNLITRLIRDFNIQRDDYLRTHHTTGSNIYEIQPNYYPQINNNYANRINQEEWSNIQRQLHDDLSRQLQVALMQQRYQQQQYRHDNTVDNYNYNTILQQLTDELNRNLTQQIQQRLRQQYGGNSNYLTGQQYETQMIQMRNMLENDLQRQLRQGLQHSQHYSWSASSSSSSAASSSSSGSNIKNYRPVRGFESYSIPLNNPDCMMGDDPTIYQQQQQDSDLDNQDLTQQLENVDIDNQKLQKLEDLDDQQQQQQQEDLLPKPPGRYNSHHRYRHHHQHHQHHQHYSNHIYGNRPPIRFEKKYFIIDSDGVKKEIDKMQFLKYYAISEHISSDSKDNLKFFIGDNFGHFQQIEPGQQFLIDELFQNWYENLITKKIYYIQDQNGEFKLVTESEFQDYLMKFRNNVNKQNNMITKFYQTDNNGIRTEINPNTFNLIGQNHISHKYYVFDSDGNRREINATEYQRLLEKPHSMVSSISNQRLYRINSHGNRQEIPPRQPTANIFGNFAVPQLNQQQQQQQTDEDLQTLEPGFEKKPQSQIGQIVDDTDLTQQQVQESTFGITAQSQIRQNQQQIQQTNWQKPQSDLSKPNSGKLQQSQLEFGQEIDDTDDLTQQVQQPVFNKPNSGKLQQQEFGQQVDDTEDLTQQVQQPVFNKPHSGNLQRPEFGQSIDDSDLTQQVQQPVFNKPQYYQRPNYGNLEINSQHRQEVQLPGKLQSQLEFGQEIDDTDLTQQVQQPVFNKPHSGNLQRPEFGQQIDDSDLTQQVQQPDFSKPYSGKLQRPEFGQQVDDSEDLTQQVQQPDFSKPKLYRKPSYGNLEISSQHRQEIQSSGKLQNQLEFGQEIDDSDLTQQVQQPVFNKPHSGNLQRPEFGQSIDDSDLTQQVQQPVFNKPHSGNLQRPEFGQQIDDSDLTQQVQQPDFSKPQSGKLQQPEFGQQVDDSEDLTQQVQQPIFNKPHSGNLQRPEFGQSIDDIDLTQQQQQVQQPDFGKPHSGRLQQPQLEFGQQVDDTEDLTQVQQPDFGKPQSGQLQQQQPEFGQQTEDLTQQVQQPDFSKPYSGKLQQPEDIDLTQQVQQPDFSKPQYYRKPSYGNLEIGSQVQSTGKLQNQLEFGQEIDDSEDLTQQVQQPVFNKPHSNRLQRPEFGQQIDDSDLTQQVQQPDFSRPQSGKLQQSQLEFGQQIDDAEDLTQQVQQPDFIKPQHYRKPIYGNLEINSQQQLEFGQQVDDSEDLTQQVQQPNFGNLAKIEDINYNQQSQKQTIDQPIEPQITNQQISDDTSSTSNQRLTEAQQTSQQLIDALQQHVDETNLRPMSYVSRPVYGSLGIDNIQVPVGTTRHISHNTYVTDNQQQEPLDAYRDVETSYGGSYGHSSYSGSHSQYSTGLSNQAQISGGIETPAGVSARVGVKTRIINQNRQQQQETTTEEIITTTEQPGFWKRLGSKVKNKAQSIRDTIF